MIAQNPTATTDQDNSYALLSLGQRALLIPQHELRTLESVMDVHTSEQPAHGVGWLQFEDNHWPVYSLDEALQPLPAMPSTQRICALLSHTDGYFGLTCSNVRTLRGTELRSRSLPAPMSNPESPLSGLVLYEDRVGVVSTASALARLLRCSGNALAPSHLDTEV